MIDKLLTIWKACSGSSVKSLKSLFMFGLDHRIAAYLLDEAADHVSWDAKI